MHLRKNLYSPFLIISYALLLLIIGIALKNIVLFIGSYYALVTTIFIFNKKRKKKFVPKRLMANYWETETMLKDVIEIDNVDISRKYFDVSPIPRHQTTYHTHPNPKFER